MLTDHPNVEFGTHSVTNSTLGQPERLIEARLSFAGEFGGL